MREAFAKMTEEQAMAVYHALAQWADNERTRDDVEEDEPRPQLDLVEAVVEQGDAVLAGLAE